MRRNALGPQGSADSPLTTPSAKRVACGNPTARAKPPAVRPCRKARRLTFRIVVFISGPPSCSRAYRQTDSRVGPATTDVACHRFVDLLIGGFGLFSEQSGRLHDLPGLAVATLRHVVLAPCELHRVTSLGVESLDRDDRGTLERGHGGDAGPRRRAVHVHGTSPTQRKPTAELRPREP